MGAKAPDFKDGQMLPGTKYRIVRQIGAGGMGVVYQVVKPPEIQGVLKLMSSDLTEHEEFRTRFLDEVRVLAQLDHPNIVKVFDYDKLPDGTPFYVMELLHGRTVRDVLATMGTLPPRVAFEVTRQLCEALHCAHTHDIPVVHRDIKPENIFLHAPRHGEPQVKLIDFGVIAVADRAHDGAFVGTWKYAAPEQIRGERAT
ncbi:MAG: eukaryotic-like serine/threonine-protein kinase, partial [Myxococcales bacterium]|nr:eukaryotic-like serine/threonine-protein kinase [Myxococcales bacterium]